MLSVKPNLTWNTGRNSITQQPTDIGDLCDCLCLHLLLFHLCIRRGRHVCESVCYSDHTAPLSSPEAYSREIHCSDCANNQTRREVTQNRCYKIGPACRCPPLSQVDVTNKPHWNECTRSSQYHGRFVSRSRSGLILQGTISSPCQRRRCCRILSASLKKPQSTKESCDQGRLWPDAQPPLIT